jgi:tetratricopeptide (TPR) repeat protein
MSPAPSRLLTTTLCATAVAVAGGISGCGSTGQRSGASTRPSAETSTRSQAAVGAVASAENAIRAGDLDRALAEFQRAIENNPTLVPAHMGMGDIYRMRGDYARAEERYARSAQIEPRNFDAQYYHGLMLHLLDRLTEAVQAYLRALSVRPNDFKANLNLATAYYQLDENTQALPYARRAVELNPEDGSARFNLGAVYAALSRHQEAVREYQQAAELLPLNPPLLLNLGESLGRLDRYEEMANALTQSLKIEQSPAAWERLGFARFRMGRFDDARLAFENALKIDANYYPALNGFGVCRLNDWIRTGRTDQRARESGLAALRRSLQANKDQPAILEIVTRYGR